MQKNYMFLSFILICNASGASYKNVSGRILKSDKLQNYNSFEKPGNIVPVEYIDAKLNGNKLQVKIPPFSV